MASGYAGEDARGLTSPTLYDSPRSAPLRPVPPLSATLRPAPPRSAPLRPPLRPASPRFAPLRPSHRQYNPKPDINMNIEYQGLVCEVQILSATLMELKHGQTPVYNLGE